MFGNEEYQPADIPDIFFEYVVLQPEELDTGAKLEIDIQNIWVNCDKNEKGIYTRRMIASPNFQELIKRDRDWHKEIINHLKEAA